MLPSGRKLRLVRPDGLGVRLTPAGMARVLETVLPCLICQVLASRVVWVLCVTALERAETSRECSSDAVVSVRILAIKEVKEGTAMLAKIARRATTTISSTRVNPREVAGREALSLEWCVREASGCTRACVSVPGQKKFEKSELLG